MPQIIVTLLFTLLLSACATAPPAFDDVDVNYRLNPETAQDQLGQTVLWGGTIIDSRNLTDRTRLEILAYPVTDSFRPDLNAESNGRFIVEQQGYLETKEYKPGRLISVKGRLLQPQSALIGETNYRYSVVGADEIKLWSDKDTGSRFHFGIGLGIIR